MKEITDSSVFLDFDKDYCESSDEIIKSELFRSLVLKFMQKLERKQKDYYLALVSNFNNKEEFLENFIITCQTALIFEFSKMVTPYEHHKLEFLTFIEEFYNYYRTLERYSFCLYSGDKKVTTHFLNKDYAFNNLVLQTYRKISENIQNEQYFVYRQLNAGSNASLILMDKGLELQGSYQKLNKAALIHTLIFYPPFIVYPKNTKREGVFLKKDTNPLDKIENLDEYFCYAIHVGRYKAYCYIHQNYTSLIVALSNLFTPLKPSEIDSNPDIIVLYGVKGDYEDPYYYYDKETNKYIGICYDDEKMSYFGYLKKLLLTLHNLICIDNKELPLHGAMVSLKFVDGSNKNIVLVGDSGAGKSETLEALKKALDESISDIKVVFDDMGALKIVGNEILAYGSETGAFVRIDDLASGYAYKQIDRAIFMNPDKKNARLIIPVSDLETIKKGYNVDMIFYANNYEDKEGIAIFDDLEKAKTVFKEGKRMAKQTTSENGLVSSYFANPFGPLQRKDDVDVLIDEYFAKLKAQNTLIGEIYTRLGIYGKEKEGPLEACKRLIKLIK